MSQSSDSANEQQRKQATVPSRDDVVGSIVEISHTDSKLSASEDKHHLQRLIQALSNCKGHFCLLFAVCNDVPERKKLTQQVLHSLSNQHPIDLTLNGRESSLLDTLLRAPNSPEPLIVHGIERLLPSVDSQRSKRERTLQELQIRREQFRKLNRPLLLWMPEYVYTLIGQQAIDFWSWQGGGFFFNVQHIKPVHPSHDIGNLSLWPDARRNQRVSNIEFVGREEHIEELLTLLRSGSSVLVHGIAGVGKTELALLVVKSLHNEYPDAQIFVSLRPPHTPAHGLREIIHAFHPEAELPDDEAVLTAIYRVVLTGKRVVIIVDDAPDEVSTRPFLPTQGSAIIVTSRAFSRLSGLTSVSVDHLSPHEARELFLSIAPPVAANTVDDICSLCKYMPLPIRLAAGFLAVEANEDPGVYVERLKNEYMQLQALKHADEDIDLTVEAALTLSYARLKPETTRVLRKLVVFPESFNSAAEERVCDDPDNACLKELVRRSLVFQERRYFLHHQVRMFIIEQATHEETRQTAKTHAAYYLEITNMANDLYRQGGEATKRGLDLFDGEWENIRAGMLWATAQFEKDSTAAELCQQYPNVAADLIELRQHPTERIQQLEAALRASQLLNQRESEGRILDKLGWAYAALNEMRPALELFEKSLSVSREVGDRSGEGNTLSHLGWVYEALGDIKQAVKLYEESLVISRDIGDRRGEGNALRNLGRTYASLHKHALALEVLEQALLICREIGSLWGEGSTYGNLGWAYGSLGEHRRAIEFHERALSIAREVGDRRSEGNTLGNLGWSYAALGETHRAIEFYEASLAIAREVGNRRAEGAAMGNLGQSFATLKEYRRAIEAYEQQLLITREIGDRRGEGNALRNLGRAYVAIGAHRKAIECFETSLNIAQQTQNRRAEAAVLSNLAVAYIALGDPSKAIKLYKRQLTIARELGDRHSEGHTLYAKSLVLSNMGEHLQAIEKAKAALSILEEIHDPLAKDISSKLCDWHSKDPLASEASPAES